MNQKHLLRFIKKKFKSVPDEVVARRKDGAPMTLAEVFEEHGITPYDLNLDALGMHTDTSTFCRFDKFNLKCDARAIIGAQFRRAILRAILRRPIATVDRYTRGVAAARGVQDRPAVHGRYCRLTAELFDDLAESKYRTPRTASRSTAATARSGTSWRRVRPKAVQSAQPLADPGASHSLASRPAAPRAPPRLG